MVKGLGSRRKGAYLCRIYISSSQPCTPPLPLLPSLAPSPPLSFPPSLPRSLAPSSLTPSQCSHSTSIRLQSLAHDSALSIACWMGISGLFIPSFSILPSPLSPAPSLDPAFPLLRIAGSHKAASNLWGEAGAFVTFCYEGEGCLVHKKIFNGKASSAWFIRRSSAVNTSYNMNK